MLRSFLVPFAFLLLQCVLAQTGVKGVDANTSDTLSSERTTVTVGPVDGASATGAFDVPPAHPDCDPLQGQERLDCTAAKLLATIRERNGEPRLDLGRFGSSMVTISIGVNQFGEAKDIRVDQLGDPQLHRNVSTAIYALPTFKPALKDDARTSATMILRYPYEELFKP